MGPGTLGRMMKKFCIRSSLNTNKRFILTRVVTRHYFTWLQAVLAIVSSKLNFSLLHKLQPSKSYRPQRGFSSNPILYHPLSGSLKLDTTQPQPLNLLLSSKQGHLYVPIVVDTSDNSSPARVISFKTHDSTLKSPGIFDNCTQRIGDHVVPTKERYCKDT